MTWGADNSVVYYLKFDATHRPYQVWVHALGTPQSEDKMIFQEDDVKFK